MEFPLHSWCLFLCGVFPISIASHCHGLVSYRGKKQVACCTCVLVIFCPLFYWVQSEFVKSSGGGGDGDQKMAWWRDLHKPFHQNLAVHFCPRLSCAISLESIHPSTHPFIQPFDHPVSHLAALMTIIFIFFFLFLADLSFVLFG